MVPGCPGKLLSVLAGLVQEKMGGSSGAVGLLHFVVIHAFFPPHSSTCVFSVVQFVPDCSGQSRDGGAEQRCSMGECNACWDTGHEEVHFV